MTVYSELTVTIKSDEGTYKQKFGLHNEYTLSIFDETIKHCIEEAKANTKITPDEVKLKISLEV